MISASCFFCVIQYKDDELLTEEEQIIDIYLMYLERDFLDLFKDQDSESDDNYES